MTTTRGTRRLREGRTQVCVDAENLIGSPFFTETEAATLALAVMDLICAERSQMQVTLATGHPVTAVALRFGFGLGRVSWRPGPDGADLELIDVLMGEHISERFDSVVIASGDGRFADVATALCAQGCHVIVIARRESLSRRLRLAASEVRYLGSSAVDRQALPAAPGLAA